MKKFFDLLILIAIASTGALAQEETGVVEADPVFASITIDGNIGDWANIPPAYIDSIGDNGASEFDFAEAYLANDNQYLYIRIRFAEPAPFGDAGWRTNIAFNTDLNAGTGFGFAGMTGSEFFVQSGAIFDQRSGLNFVDVVEQTPDNNWGAFAFADTAPYETTMDVEIRIRRDLTYSDDAEGNPGLLNPDDSPIFPYEDFIVLFEAEDESFTAVEFMPNANPAGGEAGIYYFFAEGPVHVKTWSLY